MSRSSSPLALSVVKVTVPGDVDATFAKMASFDQMNFGFHHDYTHAVMPKALRGVFAPEVVAETLGGKHSRIAKCVEALCRLGCSDPLDTRSFADFPDSGIKPVTSILWGPDITVRVKASCWYVDKHGQPVIPLLQPRKEPFSLEQLGVFARFGQQAFCKGDWFSALIKIVDLSGEDNPHILPKVYLQDDLPYPSDDLMLSYLMTYLAAKKRLKEGGKPKPRRPRDGKMDDLFDPPLA